MYSQSKTAVAVSIVFSVLAITTVALRLQARRAKSAELKSDDYFIIGALLLAIIQGVLTAYGAYHGGLGVPLYVQSPSTERSFSKIVFTHQFLYYFAVSTVKISILLFYKRIFITRGFSIAANIMMAIVTCWCIMFVFMTLFGTSPISSNWTKQGKANLNISAMLLAGGGSDISLDILTLCLPIPMIRGLHISTQRKIMVGGMFWLGIFCVIASIARLVYIHNSVSLFSAPPDANYTGDVTNIVIWSQVQPSASIVAACLPTLGPLFRDSRISNSIFSTIKTLFSNSRSTAPPTSDKKQSPTTNPHGSWRKISSDTHIAGTVGAGDVAQDSEGQREEIGLTGIKAKTGSGTEHGEQSGPSRLVDRLG